jgi:hypothetical protein
MRQSAPDEALTSDRGDYFPPQWPQPKLISSARTRIRCGSPSSSARNPYRAKKGESTEGQVSVTLAA